VVGRGVVIETSGHKRNGNVRFEVFTAVTMKNAVSWDIETQFVPHRRQLRRRYRDQTVNAM
jgi:hypothetical protein